MDPIFGCFNPHFDDIFLKVGLGFGDRSGVFTVPLDVPFWGRWMYVPRMPSFLYPSMTPLKTTMDPTPTGQKNVNISIPPKKKHDWDCPVVQSVCVSRLNGFFHWAPWSHLATGSSLKSLGQLPMAWYTHGMMYGLTVKPFYLTMAGSHAISEITIHPIHPPYITIWIN